MNKLKFITIIVIASVSCRWAIAQVITAVPAFPQATDAVTITFNAAQGNMGLKGYTGDIYAHTGVITNLSTGPSDWKYVPSNWGVNIPKCLLKKVGTDLYELKIANSIRDYYGVPESEKILQLAFVFRSSDSKKEGKTATGGDIFYDVSQGNTLQLSIIRPAEKILIVSIGDKVIVEAKANNADSIVMFHKGQKASMKNGNNFLDSINVTEKGKFWVKLEAFQNTESVVDSFYYFTKSQTITEELPAGIHDGINYLSETDVVLCLVAPNKSDAYVIGEFNDWQLDSIYQMKQTSDKSRFWIEIKPLIYGLEYAYQYLVDGKIIADPFTKKILDPFNDQSISTTTYPNLKKYPSGKTNGIVSTLQTGQAAYNWKHNNSTIPSKEKLVIYELLVRDFVANHNYQTIIDSLDYFKRLGINAIELMPVMEFENNNSWGYNPSFYFAPDKYYGTANDLKRLVDTCHSMGMAIIFDMVLNHSFGQSPMVQLYWDAANNRPASDNPWFNPIAKHDYNVGYDFNHESAYTKLFVSQVLKYWLSEFKADGFRFDLSKGFTQINNLGNVSGWGAYDASRIAIWKAIADTIWKVNDKAYVILEHFAVDAEEQELVAYGMMVWGNMNYSYCEAAMGWNEINKTDFSRGSYKVRNMENPGLVSYMESHDEERIIYKSLTWGNNNNVEFPISGNLNNSLIRAELDAAFFLTIPGPRMIWQFGELGYDIKIDSNGRTGEKPIHWDYYKQPNRFRLFSVYSELLKLRNSNEAFESTDFTLNVADSVKSIAINHASMDVRIIGNFDVYAIQADVSFSKTGWWYDYFSGDSINVTDVHQLIDLGISEYKIFTTVRFKKPDIISSVEKTNSNGNNNIKVYPNPCKDKITFRILNSSTKAQQLEIMDITGRVINKCFIQKGLEEYVLGTNDLVEGIYFAGLNGKEVIKFMKVK